MTAKPIRAALYARVSTDTQAQSGTSLDTQMEDCRKKAVQLGAEIVGLFRDEGVSGGLFTTRPGIQEALVMIEAGTANVLIAYDMTRLSRDREHQSIIDKRLAAAGARLVFCTQSFDETPEGELAKGIMGDFAAYERQKIKERTGKGRRRRAEEGLQPIRNFSPFGYHIVTQADVLSGAYPASTLGTYQVVEEQARWVREIFKRFSSGQSLRRICQWLQTSGVETPRGGACWCASVLRRMIVNPVYKGKPAYGRHESSTDETRAARGLKPQVIRKSNEEKWIELSCEPLVDSSLWETCNRRLKESRALFGGNPKNKYTLTGLIRCPICRLGMRAQAWNNKGSDDVGPSRSHSYFCPDAYPSRNSAGKVCNNHRYLGSLMDELVCKAVAEAAKRDGALEAAMLSYYQDQDQGSAEERVMEIEEELKKLDRREKAAVQAQISGIEAGANVSAYAAVFQAIYARRTALHDELQEVQKRSDGTGREAIQSVAARIQETLAYVEEALFAPEITSAERQNLLALIVKDVVPHEGGALVHLRSPSAAADSTVANITVLTQ